MNQKTNKKVNLTVLASGIGSLFESVVIACKTGVLEANIVCLVSDRFHVPVLEKACKYNVSTKVIRQKDYSSAGEWDIALCEYLQQKKSEWIVLAGFLKKIESATLKQFKNRIINIHPSLLPCYGGKGMYGRRVHESVIQSGDKVTGVSVHLVSDQYDQGLVLAQTSIPVAPDDTAKSLENKVKAVEKVFYISVLQKLIRGKK